MKSTTKFLTASLIICQFFLMIGCSPKFKLDQSSVSLKVKENPITEHGALAKLELDYEIAPKSFTKKSVVLVQLVEISQDGKKSVRNSKWWSGKKVKGLKSEVVDINKSVVESVLHEEFPGENEVFKEYWIEFYSSGINQKTIQSLEGLHFGVSNHIPESAHSFRIKVAEGVSKLGKTAFFNANAILIPSDFIPDTVQPFEATIYFEVNKSVIRESERKRKEITQLADFLSKTKEILKIEVNGYASPDGELQFNNELANERATEAGKFVVNTLQKSEGLKSIQFNLKDANLYVQNKGTEDWKGLLRGIEFARIPNKDQVKDIITDPSLSSPEKQGKLKNMKESWEIISEDYLPPLRRANMIINTKVAPRSLEERLKLIRMQSPDISASEMLAATEQIDEVSQKIEILELIKKQYPADHRSYNNLAVYDIQQNRMETAAKTLDAAAEADPKSKEVLSNQALVAYKQKNWSKLESVVGRAKKAGHSLPDYEAVLAIRAGKYTLAVQTLGDRDTDYLLALAHCLNRNYQAASQSLKGLGSTTAPVAYLKAVIGARTQNTSAVESELQKLVLLDASAAGRLNKDPEFAAYRQEGFFKKLQP